MPDIVISGSGGFIGGCLTAAFAARGLAVADYHAFRDRQDGADTFVHCANIHGSPRDNAAFTADVLATVGGRVKRFVQLQSFATLHGPGRLDATAFNFGKTPLLMAPYPYGKLLQESVLCGDARHYPGLAMRFVYLPAVLGTGGSWSTVLTTAKRNGVVLPPLMRGAARANYIEVGDIADHLAATAGDVAPGIARAILNRADSATLDWRAFFAGAQVNDDSSARAVAKLAATGAALAAYRLMTALKPFRVPQGEIDRRPPRPRPQTAPDRGAEDHSPEPVRFTGLVQHIVRTQPYIPAPC
jgi:nucleoside-diphosphate-sugar epimerase